MKAPRIEIRGDVGIEEIKIYLHPICVPALFLVVSKYNS